MGKKSLRKLALIMVLTLIGTSTVFAAADTVAVTIPSDVEGTAYEEAVKALMDKGIITGDTDGKFHPEANLTRAQACIIVVKSMNPPAAEVTGTATQLVGKSGFADMSGYGWAEGYIKYAVQQRVTKGYPDGTFRPGNNVTMNELITMVLRAAAYTDEGLGGTWPSNYTGKAAELDLLSNIPAPLPTYATKWMAAQLDYNALSKIEAANLTDREHGSGPDKVPDTKSMTYVTGSFNDSMTTYNGKAISSKVLVYTYGEKKNYSSTMALSNKLSDYREDTVYKYKNVKTPAYYKEENGKITEMVVPMDVGFSGRVYCVINETITTVNGSGEAVIGFETLTATRKITWLGEKGLADILSAQYLQGEIYELNVSNGEIQSIFKASEAGKKGAVFEEISGTASVSGWDDVESREGAVVKIISADGGAMFEIKSNASIYVIDKNNQTEYREGSISSIRSGVQIRAYDIIDDDIVSADIIVVLR